MYAAKAKAETGIGGGAKRSVRATRTKATAVAP
jgi:hypothetical protein